jgi:hypothetical protein
MNATDAAARTWRVPVALARETWIGAGIAALTAAVRIWVLSTHAGWLNADDAVTGLMARRIGHGELFTWFAGQDYMGAIEQYFQALTLLALPDSSFTLSIAPIALAAATGWLVFDVGRRCLRTTWQAAVAGVLYAVGPFFSLLWSTLSNGSYVTSELLAILGLALALRVERPGRHTRLMALAFGFVCGLALWANPQAAYLLLPAAIWFAGSVRGDLWRHLLPGAGGFVCGALPVIVWLARYGERPGVLGFNRPLQPASTASYRIDGLLQPVSAEFLGLKSAPGGQPLAHWFPASLVVAALIGALGAGLALAIVLGQLKPVFLSRAMLKEVTGLQVLGTISFLEPRVERSFLRREPVLVGAAFAGLLVAYLLTVALAEPAIRLVQTALS